MKNILPILLAVFSLSIILSSCKKDDPPTGTSPIISSGIDNIREFLANQAPQAQTFTINAQFPTSIRTEYGTTLWFSSNAFQDAQGNIVTGNVNIQVTEYMSRSEMILGDKPTTSDGQILISGGEFNVEAFQNGTELEASPSYSLQMAVPTDNPDNQMTLFTATEDPDGFVNWETNPNTEFWYTESDSSFYESCGYVSGSIEVLAGQTLTVTYNAGIDPISDHSVYISSQCGEFLFTGPLTEGLLLSASATEDCIVYINLSDFWWDGWQDASITIELGDDSMEATIPSENCDPVPFAYVYNLYTNHLGWINCDYFWNNGNPQVSIYADYPEDFNCTNTVCYLVFPDLVSVANMYCNDSDDGSQFTNVPEGTEAVICALSYDPDSETFYSAYAPITVSADLTTDLVFNETTVQDFEAYINGL